MPIQFFCKFLDINIWAKPFWEKAAGQYLFRRVTDMQVQNLKEQNLIRQKQKDCTYSDELVSDW